MLTESDQPLYSIGTWDYDLQAFTPQVGLDACINIPRSVLRTRMRALRCMGYAVGDIAVYIERTDGRSESEILEGWKDNRIIPTGMLVEKE